MNTHTPEHWVIVQLADPKLQQSVKKIFAAWDGSYLYGASWTLSSEIVFELDLDELFKFETKSGNLYKCYKQNHGMTQYMEQRLDQWQRSYKNLKFTILTQYNVQSKR